MIKHLVMFKLAAHAEGNTREQNALIIKERLEVLRGAIPALRKMKVSLNDSRAASSNYDLVLDTEFDSFSDLKAYAEHPEHVKVVDFILKVKTDRAAIDYEI